MFLVTTIIVTKKTFQWQNKCVDTKKYYNDNIGCHKFYIFSDKINMLILKEL